jgi:uncharacterized membrane protein YkoI
MNKLSTFTVAVLACGLAGAAMAAAPKSYVGHELAGRAQIALPRAEAIALKARPGKVTDRELEEEGGGLRWSFDIKSGAKTYEVGIDAHTGKLLENKAEGAHPD